MIEFVLKNRRLRLHPDNVIYVRSYRHGVETKNGRWQEINFTIGTNGYYSCCLTYDDGVLRLLKHRIVYYAHNQDWDIWDSSTDNMIDHINRKRNDNRIENLRVVTNSQNQMNRDEVNGYTWHRGKWRADIKVDGKTIHIGYFENKEDARAAYLEAKQKYHIISSS